MGGAWVRSGSWRRSGGTADCAWRMHVNERGRGGPGGVVSRDRSAEVSTHARCVGFFFQAEDGIRDYKVTGVQTCALPIWITVLEDVSNDDVFPILKSSDVFVRGNVEEGYGISRVEAIWCGVPVVATNVGETRRSEEHTSELQSPCNLVCRLLLEKKKKMTH